MLTPNDKTRDPIKLTPKNLKPPPSIQEFREPREAIKIQTPKKISYTEFLTQLTTSNNDSTPIDENYTNFLKAYIPTQEETPLIKQNLQEYIEHTKNIKTNLKNLLKTYEFKSITPELISIKIMFFMQHLPDLTLKNNKIHRNIIQLKKFNNTHSIKFYLQKENNGTHFVPNEFKSVKFIYTICDTLNRMYSKKQNYKSIEYPYIEISTQELPNSLRFNIKEKTQILNEIKEHFNIN